MKAFINVLLDCLGERDCSPNYECNIGLGGRLFRVAGCMYSASFWDTPGSQEDHMVAYSCMMYQQPLGPNDPLSTGASIRIEAGIVQYSWFGGSEGMQHLQLFVDGYFYEKTMKTPR